ncbi:MAG: PQQ-binding-like beta-propeller repeat protein [Candidatus Zixiibacteriota bacterium]
MKTKALFGIFGALIIAMLSFPVPTCLAGSTWDVTIDGEPDLCKIIDDTHGIVSTNSSIYGIDLTSGAVSWEIKDWTCKSARHFGAIPNTTLAVSINVVVNEVRNTMTKALDVFKHNEIGVIDYATGDMLWAKDTIDFLSCVGFTLLPKGNALMLCVRDSSDNYWMLSVDVKTGNVIWENKDFFGGDKPETFYMPDSDRMIDGNQAPVFDSDTTMIALYRKNQLQKWNLSTGEMIWQSPLETKSLPVLADGIMPMMLTPDGAELWVPCKKSLQTVSTIDGRVKWSVAPEFKGEVLQIIPLENQIIVKGGPKADGKGGGAFITLIDRATGERVWKEDFKKLRIPKVSPALLSGDSIYVYSNKNIFGISLADGGYAELAKDLDFEGGEKPEYFGKLNDNYLMISAQNMMMLSPTLQPVYHSYNKAPGTSFFLKALSITAQIAINTVSAMYFSIPIYSGGGYTLFMYPALRFGWPKYGNSISSDDHMFVLTKVEYDEGDKQIEGWGIKAISKADGSVDFQTMIGDKSPEYDVAPSGKAMMYLGADNTVCYRSM